MSILITPTSEDDLLVKQQEDKSIYKFNSYTRRPISDFATNTLTKATGRSLKYGFITMYFNTTLSMGSDSFSSRFISADDNCDFLDTNSFTIKKGRYLALIEFDMLSTVLDNGTYKSPHVVPWNQGGSLPDTDGYFPTNENFPSRSGYVVVDKIFGSDTVLKWDSASGKNQTRSITLFKVQDDDPDSDIKVFDSYKCDFRSSFDSKIGMYTCLWYDQAGSNQNYNTQPPNEVLYNMWQDFSQANDFYIKDVFHGNRCGTNPESDGFDDGFYGKWIHLNNTMKYNQNYVFLIDSGLKSSNLSFRGSTEIGGVGNGASFNMIHYDSDSSHAGSYSFNYWIRVDDYNPFSGVNKDRNDDGVLKYIYQPDIRHRSASIYKDTFNFEFNNNAVINSAFIPVYGENPNLTNRINPVFNSINDILDSTGKIPKVAYITLENSSDLPDSYRYTLSIGSEVQEENYLPRIPIGPYFNNTLLVEFNRKAEEDGITYGPAVWIRSPNGTLQNVKLKLHVLEWE